LINKVGWHNNIWACAYLSTVEILPLGNKAASLAIKYKFGIIRKSK